MLSSDRLHLVKGIHLLIAFFVPSRNLRVGSCENKKTVPLGASFRQKAHPSPNDLSHLIHSAEAGIHSGKNPIRNRRWVLYLN